jgi:hypothetical protein
VGLRRNLLFTCDSQLLEENSSYQVFTVLWEESSSFLSPGLQLQICAAKKLNKTEQQQQQKIHQKEAK